ncbi:response regulator [Paenibacillus sp. NPDC058071]|uniref:response regulator transcription factor n=1 Tax=Paenibacillus sp. NPDC058071 TaxID=3346326 RepID=UPI0036DE6DAF
MSHLLIVDDEPIAIEGLLSGMNWEDLGFSQVSTAFSAEQAKAIFEHAQIDVMLCDIEMPKETGLQLLEWVRTSYPSTETIFLTCHADFQFAKQAIGLGSLDYLLKPVLYNDLEAALRKALRKIEEDSTMSKFSQYGKFWVKHQSIHVERFWMDVLSHEIPSHAEAIRKVAEERNIPYSNELLFLPIFIHIRRWYKEFSLRDKKIMENALLKSAEELILEKYESGFVFSTDQESMLAVLNGDLSAGIDIPTLKESCEKYVQACPQYFYCDVACYIGEPVHGYELAAMYRSLVEKNQVNVSYDSHVFIPHEQLTVSSARALPDMGLWALMLKEGARDDVLRTAINYIDELLKSSDLSSELLRSFVQNFQQMIHYVLQVKGIQAHQLLGDSESSELYAKAQRSAQHTTEWIRHTVSKSMDYVTSLEQSPNVVDKAKAYILERLEEDISREDIAAHVFLNPDYLTRIFKKETGQSISDYLLQQRLSLAANLLLNTEMPISAIASRIGYSNFSHFSRIFKKNMALGPLEYRQKGQR